MNCREWEERIALYAGGDSTPAEAAEAERHLAGCAECRASLSEMRRSLEELCEAHREPVVPAHYAAVRARVVAKIEAGRVERWKRAWVYGLVLAAAAVLAMLMVRPHGPALVAHKTPAPAVQPALAERAPVAIQAAVESPVSQPHRRVKIRAKKQKPETILVKVETDNPDVVIYWIAETKGD